MVFGGDPKNPRKLAHNSGNLLTRSATAGHSWTSEFIDAVTVYPRANMQNSGDPKVTTAKNYKGFYLSSLFADTSSTTRTMLGGILSKGIYAGNINASIFQDIPFNPPANTWLFADYPKLAVDPQSSSLYISATAWFEDIENYQLGLYSSRDAGRTFVKEKMGYGSAITSMTVGADGTLYAVRPGVGTNDELFRFRSVQPLGFDTYRLSGGNRTFWPARISTNSKRAWHIYGGPEIVVDNAPRSRYRGRLYAVWAQEEKAIADPNFEYPFYGYNFDVFASYSDNRGETWSQPVKVNDDNGTGDQFFPSVDVDDRGKLHVAFVDHRDHQDQALFDVYYAKSSDGITFSKNIRVTDAPVSNNPNGGRTIGDYLDMTVAYPGSVYVAYPCGQSENSGPTGACMAEMRTIRIDGGETVDGAFDE